MEQNQALAIGVTVVAVMGLAAYAILSTSSGSSAPPVSGSTTINPVITAVYTTAYQRITVAGTGFSPNGTVNIGYTSNTSAVTMTASSTGTFSTYFAYAESNTATTTNVTATDISSGSLAQVVTVSIPAIPTPTVTPTGPVYMNVYVSTTTNNAIGGWTLTYTNSSGQQNVVNMNSYYTTVTLPTNGTYWITVAQLGYTTQGQSVSEPDGNGNNVYFMMVPSTSSVSQAPTAPASWNWIVSPSNALITVKGATTITQVGSGTMSIPPGTYTVTVTAPGYVTQSQTDTFTSYGNGSTNFSLAQTVNSTSSGGGSNTSSNPPSPTVIVTSANVGTLNNSQITAAGYIYSSFPPALQSASVAARYIGIDAQGMYVYS